MPWRRALTLWLLIILAESVHGTLRTVYLAPVIGDFRSRQLGVFTGTFIIYLVALTGSRWLGSRDAGTLLRIGALWVGMTVLFEVLLGRLVLGYDWPRVLADYDLAHGGLLGLGLVAMFFTPLLAARLVPDAPR